MCLCLKVEFQNITSYGYLACFGIWSHYAGKKEYGGQYNGPLSKIFKSQTSIMLQFMCKFCVFYNCSLTIESYFNYPIDIWLSLSFSVWVTFVPITSANSLHYYFRADGAVKVEKHSGTGELVMWMASANCFLQGNQCKVASSTCYQVHSRSVWKGK